MASAAAAVAGLLLLALMLDRVGGSLAAVVAELRAGTDCQRFASELAEALDGVDSEAEAFAVIERAMGHAAGAGRWSCRSLNDTYGHAAGDRALRLFARYGGEEFVLVFPGTTGAETAESLERLRAALALATGTSGGPAFTASFGVADTTAGATLDEVIQAADGALLRAKELGRDRVAIAGAEEGGRHRRPSAAVAATPAG